MDSLALNIFNFLINTLGGFVDKVYVVLMGSWPGMTIVALYTVIVGYQVIFGYAGERSKQWAVSILLLLVVGGVSNDQSAYTEWVSGWIYDLAYNLASVAPKLTDSKGVAGMFHAMEDAVGRTLATVDNIEVPGNFFTDAWLYFKVGVACLLLALLVLVLYLATLGLLCMAFFSLFMMLLVGGPCLWLASFKETRGITWAWLKQTANYCLWIFFLGIVASVGISFVSLAVEGLTRWDLEADGVFTKDLGSSMLLMALTIAMLWKCADWAAAITGGTATNAGVIGAVGSAAGGALGGAVNAAGGAAGGALGGAAKWAGGVAANKTAAGAAAYRAYSALRGLGKPQ